MPHITRALIRKRAEHNEGMISTLEEISLHQEELESIAEVLGTTCRKLKILYLQNNIIPRMENLHHFKELEYLNLALNNVAKIEGLGRCEFLNKLDLTVNFVDFDTLEESISNLTSRVHLRELYMMGNPAQMDWEEGFSDYVIHRLPQLTSLDGKQITKSMRIVAAQAFPRLERELREKAAIRVASKAQERAEKEAQAAEKQRKREAKALRQQQRAAQQAEAKDGLVEDVSDGEEAEEEADPEEEDENVPHTPEARVDMYRELAEEKAEKEAREKERQPKERNYSQEQQSAVERIRQMEEEGRIRQCNEGKWEFSFDEVSKPGHVVLDVGIQRHLDSSLIDVDIHPNYASLIIKSKVLRLNLPAEVSVSASKAQRSKTTGHLVLVMPKVNPNENAVSIRSQLKEKQEAAAARERARLEAESARANRNVAAQMQAAAVPANRSRAVNIAGLVSPAKGGIVAPKPAEMTAVSTNRKAAAAEDAEPVPSPPPPLGDAEGALDQGDEDEPPPPM